jgi:dihydroxy-acid dehydratase
MTALYLERYMNFGLSQDELQSGRPIIGIAQTGSDLSPCNRHHLELAQSACAKASATPAACHRIPGSSDPGNRQAPDRRPRPQPVLSRPRRGALRLSARRRRADHRLRQDHTGLSDGRGNRQHPGDRLSVGPMLNGWFRGERTGSGTIVWKAREMLARGEIDYQGFVKLVASSAPSTGYCNTMGTATTMNSLAEALGMQLPGAAAIPAPYRDRQEISYETGKRIVEMVREDLKPSDILTKEAFINAIKVNSAIGGSTNAPIHLNALARHVGVELTVDDWQTYGEEIPLLVNLQPAGEYLGEDYYHAGGVPAVMGELIKHEHLHHMDAMTVNGKTVGENYTAEIEDEKVIRPFDRPLKEGAGFRVLKGNLFSSAIMKTSVISPEFRDRYLSNPNDPEAFEGPRRRVRRAGGLSPPHRRSVARHRRHTILFMRGAGPIGYPGAAEVVNMRPPDYL